MTFEEFQKHYTIYEGPQYKVKNDKMTTWYIKGKDEDGIGKWSPRGYYAHAGDKKTAIWTLRRGYDCLIARGEL